MIKTDQNADYYEGAMDALLEIPKLSLDLMLRRKYNVLLKTCQSLRDDYYDRFAADCAPKDDEVEI